MRNKSSVNAGTDGQNVQSSGDQSKIKMTRSPNQANNSTLAQSNSKIRQDSFNGVAQGGAMMAQAGSASGANLVQTKLNVIEGELQNNSVNSHRSRKSSDVLQGNSNQFGCQ